MAEGSEPSFAENGGNARSETTPLAATASFRGSSSRRRAPVRPSLDADEFMNLLHGSDPVKVELNRLENEVRGEKWELIRLFGVWVFWMRLFKLI